MDKFLFNIKQAVLDFAQFSNNSDLDNKRNRFLFGFFSALIVTHLCIFFLDLYVSKYQFVPSHIIRLVVLVGCLYFLNRNKAHASLYISISVFYMTVAYNVFSMPNYSIDALILFPLGAGMFIIARNYILTFVYFLLSCLLFIAAQYFQITYQQPIFDLGSAFTIFAIFCFFYASLAFFVYEFKYFEKEIKAKNGELSAAVDKLTDQNAKLEDTNQLIVQIMSVIGHDLRNPFNNMIGYSTLLHKNFSSYEDNKKKHFVAQILTSSEQGNAVLENLLNWARSHSGAFSVVKTNTDIINLVNYIIREQEFQSQQKDVYIFNEVPESLFIKTDAVLFSTIIRNLVQNSIKFSPQNKSITISIKQVADDICVSVRNFGAPIPEEQQKIILSKTMPISTIGTVGEKGSGLGLLICHDFATHLGGRLSLHSDTEYTEFSVHIPI